MGYQLGNTLGLIFFHGMKPQTVETLKHRLTEEAYDFQLTRLATPDESTG
jgi:hypothetical protein